MLYFLRLTTSRQVVRVINLGLDRSTSTDGSGEDAAHPKCEGGKKERKRRRRRTGRLTTGEEGPLPQGPLGTRFGGPG